MKEEEVEGRVIRVTYRPLSHLSGRGVWTGREKTMLSLPMCICMRGRTKVGKGTSSIRLPTYLRTYTIHYKVTTVVLYRHWHDMERHSSTYSG